MFKQIVLVSLFASSAFAAPMAASSNTAASASMVAETKAPMKEVKAQSAAAKAPMKEVKAETSAVVKK